MTSFHPVKDSHLYTSTGKQKPGRSLTGFQKKVYKVVRKIPKGKVLTYKMVAKKAGKPRAWRAVGNILAKNKDKKIPCHRVIKSNGRIGGYRYGTKKKTSLLKKEGVDIFPMRVS